VRATRPRSAELPGRILEAVASGRVTETALAMREFAVNEAFNDMALHLFAD
jgi:hypothetical protein